MYLLKVRHLDQHDSIEEGLSDGHTLVFCPYRIDLHYSLEMWPN